jgi:hypothetical protein
MKLDDGLSAHETEFPNTIAEQIQSTQTKVAACPNKLV